MDVGAFCLSSSVSVLQTCGCPRPKSNWGHPLAGRSSRGVKSCWRELPESFIRFVDQGQLVFAPISSVLWLRTHHESRRSPIGIKQPAEPRPLSWRLGRPRRTLVPRRVQDVAQSSGRPSFTSHALPPADSKNVKGILSPLAGAIRRKCTARDGFLLFANDVLQRAAARLNTQDQHD